MVTLLLHDVCPIRGLEVVQNVQENKLVDSIDKHFSTIASCGVSWGLLPRMAYTCAGRVAVPLTNYTLHSLTVGTAKRMHV